MSCAWKCPQCFTLVLECGEFYCPACGHNSFFDEADQQGCEDYHFDRERAENLCDLFAPECRANGEKM